MSAGVLVSECPIEGGDVDAAARLAHQADPRLEDGGVAGAGVELHPLRDALHQNDPDRGEEQEVSGDIPEITNRHSRVP